jgi:sec-independent protein translocase protein TatC
MQFLPENTSMVAIDVVSPFLTPFKLVLVASLNISSSIWFFDVGSS